jgi:hypothetical protein
MGATTETTLLDFKPLNTCSKIYFLAVILIWDEN